MRQSEGVLIVLLKMVLENGDHASYKQLHLNLGQQAPPALCYGYRVLGLAVCDARGVREEIRTCQTGVGKVGC